MSERKEAAERLEREINLMGFAEHRASQKLSDPSQTDGEQPSGQPVRLEVSGSDAFYRLRFKHAAR